MEKNNKYFEVAKKSEKCEKNEIDIYCSNIISTLSFHQKTVSFCTTLSNPPVLSYYNGGDKNIIKEVIDSRNKYIKDFSQDIICPECKDCHWKTQDILHNNLISRIDLFHWFHCNCGCFYCSYINETRGKYSDKVKPGRPVIYKIIKELYKENKIDKEHLMVVWGGGEIAMLKEFPKMIKLFLRNGVNFISVESSGIKYSKMTGKLLKLNKGAITIAICSGSKETYKMIKRRDKYNKVIENIKNYLKDAKKNPDKVISKFIILKNFNNNIEEVEKWLCECKLIGIKKVEISIEFCWGEKRKRGKPVELYNYEIFDYVEKRCKELGLILQKNSTSMKILEDGIY